MSHLPIIRISIDGRIADYNEFDLKEDLNASYGTIRIVRKKEDFRYSDFVFKELGMKTLKITYSEKGIIDKVIFDNKVNFFSNYFSYNPKDSTVEIVSSFEKSK